MSNSKSVFLKLTGAIALTGALIRAGTVVEVDEPTARNLLQRGKAELATSPNAPAEEIGAGDNEFAEAVTLAEGVEMPMAMVIREAQTEAQLTSKKWKALPLAEQDKFIDATIERLKAEAAAK